MNKTIPQKTRYTSDQILKLRSFKKARRAILRLQILENRVEGRGRTCIPRLRLRIRVRARRSRSPASVRRATVDSGGSGDPDPEPPRPLLYSLPASPVGGGL